MTTGKTYNAGTIFLQVVPVFGDVMNSIRREAKDLNKALADDTAESIEEGVDRGSKKGAAALEKNLGKGAKTTGRKAAEDFAGEFETNLDKALEQVQKNIKAINVRVERNEVRKEISGIKKELDALSGTARLDMDDAEVVSRIEWLKAQLSDLKKRVTIKTSMDIDAAERTLESFERRVENSRPALELEIRTAKADREMGTWEKKFRATVKKAAQHMDSEIGGEIGQIRRRLLELSNTDLKITAHATEAMNEIRLLEARLAELGDANVDIAIDSTLARAELRTFQADLDRIDGRDVDVQVDVDAAKAIAELTLFGRLLARLDGRRAASHVDLAGNSFRAFNILILAAVTLLPALVPILAAVAGGFIALGPAIAGVVAGLGVMILGFSGIGKAVTALGDVQKNAKKDALAHAKALRDAAESVADAQRSLARAREDAAERQSDAARAVARAEEDAADMIKAALERQRDAQRSLTRAQEDAATAQRNLMEARREAEKDLQDTDDRIRQTRLDIRQAQIDLFDATIQDNAVQSDPGATNLEKEQSEVNRLQATERLKELRDLELELLETKEKGVDGSERVKSAEEAVTDALEAQKEAAKSLKEAQEEVSEARIDAAERVSDALREQRRAAEDSAEAISDAQRNLLQAQQNYNDVLAKTGEIGSASMQALNDAMSKLSPAGQQFALFLHSLRDEFHAIRAAAQESMLPGVQTAIQILMSETSGFKDFVSTMGAVIGDLFVQFAKMLTNPLWTEFFGMLSELGPGFMKSFGQTTMNWMSVFAKLLIIAAPWAQKFSDALLKISENALAFMESEEGTKIWQDFLGYVAKVGPKVWEFLKNLFKAIVNLAKALAPVGELILAAVNGFLEFIAAMPPRLLGAIVTAIIALVVAFQAVVGITALVASGMVVLAAGTFALVVGAIVLVIGALVALYTQSETARNIINAAIGAIGVAFKWVWENLLQPAIQGLGIAMTWLWENVIQPTLPYIQAAWEAMVDGIVWAWQNILWPALQAIFNAITWLWKNIIKPYLGFIIDFWTTVFKAMVWVWQNILWPILDLIFTIVGKLWSAIFRPVLNDIQSKWKTVMEAMKWVWENVLDPVFTAIGDALGVLVGTFTTVVDTIGLIWDGLVEILGKPIVGFIDLVLNKGIIAGFNKIADFVGSKKMSEIPLPSFEKKTETKKGNGDTGPNGGAYAFGGITPGYTPGRDVMYAHVSGGEAIMRPEWTRAVGREQIYEWNRIAAREGVRGLRQRFAGGFKAGGVIDDYKRVPFRGVTLNMRTLRMLMAAENMLKGQQFDLTQGSYSTRVSQSGGTHDGGGAFDAWSPFTAAAIAALRAVGFAAWRRYPNQGDWNSHIHGIALGDREASDAARAQMSSYMSGGDGMGGKDYEARLTLKESKGLLDKLGGILSGAGDLLGKAVPGFLKDAVAAPIKWLKGMATGALEKVPGMDLAMGIGGLFKDIALHVAEMMGKKALDLLGLGGGNQGPEDLMKMARSAAKSRGWTGKQWDALDWIISKESGWDPAAQNPTSTAFGLFQFLDSTWAGVGGKKTGDPAEQIRLGLNYISQRYGSPLAAKAFHEANGYYSEGGVVGSNGLPDNGTMMYDNGGYLPPGLTTVLNLTGKPEPVFTADQFANLGSNQGRAGVDLDINLNGTDVTAHDVAEELLFALATVDNGGRYSTGARD